MCFTSSSRVAFALLIGAFAGTSLLVIACGSSDSPVRDADAGFVSLGDGGGFFDVANPDANKTEVDGGFAAPDGDVIPADRFVTHVVSFTPGQCAGFGASSMPDIVLGPPVGAGDLAGSLDVVSLGIGGEIVVSFEPNAIIDGPGADFIVFENAFYAGGNKSNPVADLGEVSVSDDGIAWKTYTCTPGDAPPYGKCAGWHAVYSAPGNGISPLDPTAAGGEAYDLADLGIATAKFVRIRDVSKGTCDAGAGPRPNEDGFDLDAVSIIHSQSAQ